MPTHLHESTCRFECSAEQLVLFGYRNWSYGYRHHSETHIQESWALHTKHLDNISQAKEVLDALILFVNALSECASCPLRSKPTDQHSVTREEGLILGLISAIQNGNDHVAETCLNQLTCASRCWELSHAAERYAITLRALNQKLQPIPMSLIEQLLLSHQNVSIH
ncbi:hypothetical protein [Lentilitoribacter sp. EG35]|uniref:hypothetical protein n=1 Tax=Lentilitoribacter sp. EG35 TaxID=3234192 RepID=UPI0034614BE8